jgi:hypothetical protein
MTHHTSLWKSASLAFALGVPFAVLGVVADHLAGRAAASTRLASVHSQPVAPRRVVEECNQLAAQAPRDRTRVLPDRVMDAALGPGEGAGSGILAGVTAGSLAGISEDNRKSEYGVAAYRRCMARRGY